MKCSEKGCPFPARQDGVCAGHLRDRQLEVSMSGGSIPMMQEFAMSVDWGYRGAGGPGRGARHIGPYKSAGL
jgi:hypothetical protein